MWLMPLLLSLWVCGGDVAEACSCGPRSATCGPPEDFWRVGAVFAGRVTAIDRPAGTAHPGKRRVRIQIIEKFRGDITDPGGEVTVFTDAIALCGFPFRVGKEYFVYAAPGPGTPGHQHMLPHGAARTGAGGSRLRAHCRQRLASRRTYRRRGASDRRAAQPCQAAVWNTGRDRAPGCDGHCDDRFVGPVCHRAARRRNLRPRRASCRIRNSRQTPANGSNFRMPTRARSSISMCFTTVASPGVLPIRSAGVSPASPFRTNVGRETAHESTGDVY